MASAAAGGTTPPAPETRDWASMPRDILSTVFLNLGPREVMLGAEFACTAWRRAALDEPALWRRVGMDPWHKLWRYVKMESAMKLAAVERSACQCEAFKGILLASDLLDLAQRAPSLKTLNLEHSRDEERSIRELTEALEKFPLLEDLTIYLPYVLMKEDDDLLGYICHACPRLKKLVVMYASPYDVDCKEGEFSKQPIDGGITLMPELRSLQLYEVDLSIEGLNDILDNCPQKAMLPGLDAPAGPIPARPHPVCTSPPLDALAPPAFGSHGKPTQGMI
ncbi:hypothetical protein EJB05_52425, partial [Eragrostis curvula]